MRLTFIENRIKNRLERWSSLGHSWNDTSIKRAMLKWIQPIMNFIHTNRPLAIEVLNNRQKNETAMHFLGELTNMMEI